MKRDLKTDDAAAGEPVAKRVHTAEEETALQSMGKQQEELDKMDAECAVEQMKIQQAFDAKKKPIFEERQKLIAKVSGFWGKAIINAVELNQDLLADQLHEDDQLILEHLERVELDDNLDFNGSYKLSFVFNDKVKEWFEPTTLTKSVKFLKSPTQATGGAGDEQVETPTEIKWVEGKKPQPMKGEKGEDDDEGEDDETMLGPQGSILEWFAKADKDAGGDLGEMIRRQVFHQPHQYYAIEEFVDGGDDDEEDDEEDADDVPK